MPAGKLWKEMSSGRRRGAGCSYCAYGIVLVGVCGVEGLAEHLLAGGVEGRGEVGRLEVHVDVVTRQGSGGAVLDGRLSRMLVWRCRPALHCR